VRARPAGRVQQTSHDTMAGPGGYLWFCEFGGNQIGSGASRNGAPAGMGSRIVEALVRQIGDSVATNRGPKGYAVELRVPLPEKTVRDEDPDRRR
jgi:hypothetical protein